MRCEKIKFLENPFMDEFSKSARRSIRRALRAGVDFRVIEGPDDLSDLKEIYYSTMDRNKASDFYHFGDGYFKACLQFFRKNIALVEESASPSGVSYKAAILDDLPMATPSTAVAIPQVMRKYAVGIISTSTPNNAIDTGTSICTKLPSRPNTLPR